MTQLSPRIGIIGLGRWAEHYHLPGIMEYEGCQLTAVADTNTERVGSLGDRLGGAKIFAHHEALLDVGLVDGVVIAAPHPYHYQLTKAALSAGVSVFVEKPLTLRADEAWELVELADRQGLHLMLGYTHQLARTAKRLRELIDTGALGDLVHVSVVSAVAFGASVRNSLEKSPEVTPTGMPPVATWYGDPGMGGGLGHMQTTHSVGMMFYITGRAAVDVTAYMSQHDLPVDVVNAIAFRLDNGAVGTVASTGTLALGTPGRKELCYYGTQGVARQNPIQGTLDVWYSDGRHERTELPPEERTMPREPVRRFADLLAGRGENPAPGEPAARAVELIEAAYRSATEGRAVSISEHGVGAER